VEEDYFGPVYVQSAFEFPKWPVIPSESPGKIMLFNWGLIPAWVRDKEAALEFRVNTINARSETIFDKPAFRQAAASRHCLVLADGFFEFRELDGKKIPYFIRLKGGRLFAIAGLYDYWTNHETGERIPTFTIITTDANRLMETIHNRKKRMPVILTDESERDWLKPGRGRADLLKPFADDQMEAWPVSRLLTARGIERNVPQVQEPFDYPEISGTDLRQGSLF
jgi:putative SOS response-associated peptidase YedK